MARLKRLVLMLLLPVTIMAGQFAETRLRVDKGTFAQAMDVKLVSDGVLVLSRDGLRFVGDDGKVSWLRQKPGINVFRIWHDLVVCQEAKNLFLLNRKTLETATIKLSRRYRVEFPERGNVFAVTESSKTGQTISKYNTAGKLLDTFPVATKYPIRFLDIGKSRFLTCQRTGGQIFATVKSMTFWKGDRQVRELREELKAARLLRISPKGRVYVTTDSKQGNVLVVFEPDGKEIWRKPFVTEGPMPARVFAFATDHASGHDRLLFGYRDPKIVSLPGRIRLLLIGDRGEIVRDLSMLSQGYPVVSLSRKALLLTDQKHARCVDLANGRQVWQLSALQFRDGKTVANAFSKAGPSEWFSSLTEQVKGQEEATVSTKFRIWDLRDGKVVYEAQLDGKGWELKGDSTGSFVAYSRGRGVLRVIRLRVKRQLK